MGEEYRRWCEEHPNATEEEKEKAFQKYIDTMEARTMVMNMLLRYRYS